jgi:hypothetical protein
MVNFAAHSPDGRALTEIWVRGMTRSLPQKSVGPGPLQNKSTMPAAPLTREPISDDCLRCGWRFLRRNYRPAESCHRQWRIPPAASPTTTRASDAPRHRSGAVKAARPSSRPVTTSHIATVRSPDADSSLVPCAMKASPCTPIACPSTRPASIGLCLVFHHWTVPSAYPAAQPVPSPVRATAVTGMVCRVSAR